MKFGYSTNVVLEIVKPTIATLWFAFFSLFLTLSQIPISHQSNSLTPAIIAQLNVKNNQYLKRKVKIEQKKDTFSKSSYLKTPKLASVVVVVKFHILLLVVIVFRPPISPPSAASEPKFTIFFSIKFEISRWGWIPTRSRARTRGATARGSGEFCRVSSEWKWRD